MRGTQKAGLVVMVVVGVAATACGNTRSKVDDSLSRDLAAAGGAASDLQLAPRGGSAQTVVSAIEAGETSAPKAAVHKPVAKPVTHEAPLRAAPQQTAPAPSASVAQAQPAPQPVAPAPNSAQASRDVPPLPPFPDAQGAGKARQAGKYGTEAEIFQRMPWIRP